MGALRYIIQSFELVLALYNTVFNSPTDFQTRKTMQETYPHGAVSLVKLTLARLDKLFLIFYETPTKYSSLEKKNRPCVLSGVTFMPSTFSTPIS